ncbi:MAG TPA: hypothetical protein VG389_26955 [Myxococcota bacterium]|nr:hypothetical protein [Myxococcota bacterium]
MVAAAAALSSGGRFHFTRAQLYWALVRQGALPPPEGWPETALEKFRAALDAHERDAGAGAGALAGLVRPEAAAAELAPPAALDRDVFDYTVRRYLVFERPDPMIAFALDGFHQKIEIGLLAAPGFPVLVWRQMEKQIRAGFPTTLYLVHDASRDGFYLRRRLAAALDHVAADGKKPRLVDAGIGFAQAFKEGTPAFDVGRPLRLEPRDDVPAEDEPLLREGRYAPLEALGPLELMRLCYRRIAKSAEEPGFG